MKKELVILFTVLTLILSLAFIQNVRADAISGLKDQADSAANQIKDVQNTITNADARSAFLQEQWAKFFNNTWYGQYIMSIGVSISKLDSVWKVTLGTPFTDHKWLWFFVLFLDLFMLKYLLDLLSYPLFTILERINLVPESLTDERKKKITNLAIGPGRWLVAILIVLAVSSLKLTYGLAFLTDTTINKIFSSVIYQVAIYLLLLFALFWITTFTGIIKKNFKAAQKGRELKETKNDVETLISLEKEKEEAEQAEEDEEKSKNIKKGSLTEDEKLGKEFLKELGKKLRKNKK